MGKMPGAPIGIDGRIGDGGQGPVGFPAFSRSRLSIDCRPHEGMAEGDPLTQLQQARELGRTHGVDVDAEELGSLAHE
jgi:hypothetical protein